MPLTVSREELDPLHDEWEGVLARMDEPVPFVHPAWQRVWRDEFAGDRNIAFYAVRDGGELVGVAPLLRADGRVSFAGDPKICDYMDAACAPERAGEFTRALVDALAEEEWSEIDLWGLRDGSPLLAEVEAAARERGLEVTREEEAVAPRVTLPGSWDEYISSLSKKDRHELRRKMRRLGGLGELELRTFTEPDDVESHLPTLLRQMVESRADKAQFLSEQMGRFFHTMARTLAEEGLVRLYVLELDGQAIASVLCFDQGGQLYMYNSGYDPEYAHQAAGLVSKAMLVNDAIELGRHCVDMLRGHEPYKYDLGGRDLQVYRCIIRR